MAFGIGSFAFTEWRNLQGRREAKKIIADSDLETKPRPAKILIETHAGKFPGHGKP
jgi:hypothetical protein